jgi:hypothetical protein
MLREFIAVSGSSPSWVLGRRGWLVLVPALAYITVRRESARASFLEACHRSLGRSPHKIKPGSGDEFYWVGTPIWRELGTGFFGWRSEGQHDHIQEALDDVARLYKETAQVQERTEELRTTVKELKQRLRETRAESRRHSRTLNPQLKRTA